MKVVHSGILACDPSFKGMAWTLYVPVTGYFATKVYDIRQGLKGYDRLPIILRLVREHLNELFVDLIGEWMPYISAFVIESQWKTKLTRLQTTVMSMVTDRLAESLKKIVTVPAYSWRELYGLEGSTYVKRKKISVEFLAKSPKFLAWAPGLKDDNACESIILLNYLVTKHGLSLEQASTVHSSLVSETTMVSCPKCNQPCVQKISGPNAKNPNRAFWSCTPCNKFNGFVDEGSRNSGSKRPAPQQARSEPAGKRRYNPEPQAAASTPTPPTYATSVQVRAIHKEMREMHAKLDAIYVAMSGGSSNEQQDEGGITDLYCNDEEMAQDQDLSQ